MSAILSASHDHTVCGLHSHAHKTIKTHFDSLLPIIEKITAIGLGVFSAFTSFSSFVPFFIGGACLGIYGHMQNKDARNITNHSSSCAYGLIEQLTQVSLPPVVSLAANVAMTVCHIDHHAEVFVPIIALSLGAWAGKMTAYYIPDFSHHLSKKLFALC